MWCGRPLKQSLLLSLLAASAEIFALQLLASSGVPSLGTVVSGVLMMQAALAVASAMFSVLWFRALRRVRDSIRTRTEVLQRVDAAMTGLSPDALRRVSAAVTLLQAVVRGRQSRLRYERVLVMESFEAAASDRNHLLRAVHALVVVYLVLCLYVICLYGTYELVDAPCEFIEEVYDHGDAVS